MSREVILTGLRSNSAFHIGNYLGAILPVVNLQKSHSKTYQINMFVPDLHSLTTPIDHAALYKQTISNLTVYAAAGLDIDDENTYIYRQSHISAHSELTWILDCFSYVGELNRMTQYKEKSDKVSSMGLLNYPVLMAADILLYDAKWVPLGDDQKQHLELTRDVAIRFNNKFGKNIFTVPEEWKKQLSFTKREQGVRIRSLRNPDKKMSKSVDDPAGTIMLNDKPDEASKKIMSATTDSVGSINLDWEKQPGVSNLLQILAILEGKQITEIAMKWKGQTSYGNLKQEVASKTGDFLKQFQTSLKSVDETKLLAKLKIGETKMSEVAKSKLFSVQQSVGLRP